VTTFPRHFRKAWSGAALVLAAGLLAVPRLPGSLPEPAPRQNPDISVISRTSGGAVLEITFPPLEAQDSHAGLRLLMGDLPLCPGPGGVYLPRWQRLAPGRAADLSLKVLEAHTAVLPLEQDPARFRGDEVNPSPAGQTFLSDRGSARAIDKNVYFTGNRGNWAELRDLGQFRGLPLAALEIRPVRWDARRREAVGLTRLKLQLSWPESGPAVPAALPPHLQGLALPLVLPAPAAPPAPLPLNSLSQADEPRLKIYVSQEGLYHLGAGDLAAAGLDLSGVDPRTLRLENRGLELPLYVGGEADGRFDENDYLEFWGEGLHGTYTQQNPEIYSDLYTDVNVYWLSWGGTLGARLVEESGEVVETRAAHMLHAVSYPCWRHFETNSYYNRLSQVDPDSLKEHWYFDSGVKASQTRDYPAYLPWPDDNALSTVRVRVVLQGLTYPDEFGQGGQHHVYVSLNGQNTPALEAGSAGASSWVGQTGVILDTGPSQGISSTVMVHGQNQLSLFVPVDTDAGPNDTVLLNWFEITYPRLYRADADLIRFAPPQNATPDTLVDFRLDGFTSSQISVYKLGQSKIINAEVIPYQQGNQTLYKLHFQDRPGGQPQYLALTPAAKLLPDSTVLDPGSDLRQRLTTGAPVKLLVIAARDFEDHPQLEAYLERRQAGLGRTELAFMDDVFDEYSEGIYTPQAIKDLILSLPQPPQFLLLVGDASYDTRNHYGLGGNLVPAMYVQTKAYGAVASDFWYSRLDGDMIPDLAVGRISARSPAELADYLDKLEEYETDPDAGAWRGTHLFVSGTGGVTGLSFLQLSQQIISRLPDDVMVERLATDPVTSPFYGGTTDLIDRFDEGALVIDYNGHGAGAVWSDNSLFRLENLPQLSNQGRYPFITNFTCFIGAFDTPEQGTILGEEFIFEAEKGAIGVLGSSGLGWFINGSWLQEQLVARLYGQPGLSLGELINAAKTAYYSYYGLGQSQESFDTVHLMNLLGDPSLVLAHADAAPQVQAAPLFVATGDSLHLSLPGNFSGSDGLLRLYDNQDYPVFQYGMPFEAPVLTSGDSLWADFLLPALDDTAGLTGGTCRLAWWDPAGEQSSRGAAPFFLASAYGDSAGFDSLRPTPDPVYARDAFGFRVKILDPQGVASAWAHFRMETDQGLVLVEHDSLPLFPQGAPGWYQTEAAIDTTAYPYGPFTRVIAWAEAVDSAGGAARNEDMIFYVLDSRPDPAWVDESLRLGLRQNGAALIVEVRNAGQTVIDSLDVSFHLLEPAPQPLGTVILRGLAPDTSAEAWIPLALDPGPAFLQVRLNDSAWVDDATPTDPYDQVVTVDHFTVTPETGTGDTLTLGGIFRVYLPAGATTGPGVLTLRERRDLELSGTQPGLNFVLQDSSGPAPGWGLETGFLGGWGLTGDSLWISADLAAAANPPVDVALHRQEPGQGLWQKLAGEVSPGGGFQRYGARTALPGAFTLLENGDHQGPEIEITVEGQIYTSGGYVPDRPKISALVQDPGGVHSTPGSWWLAVDNQTVDTSQVAVSLDPNGQVLTLSLNPTFAVGPHTVRVMAQDLSGNASTDTIAFQVAGQFNLNFVGNYPNPMKDQTYFAYSLTEQTTEPVEIRIYTVSGRLVKVLRSNSAEEINYGEIYWDGRDEEGMIIANGVYFYKILARRDDQSIERTMKLAKLR